MTTKTKTTRTTKPKEYRDIEIVRCKPLDDLSNECWLMHTPENIGITIPMNIKPIIVNTVNIKSYGEEGCSLFNQTLSCSGDDGNLDCKHHTRQSLLECGEYVLE